ncbi:hypothetical protein KY285_036753 [Solanum tuberosum]|nr:hypothetical protein KY285_036753 [Solanum tuberosum]
MATEEVYSTEASKHQVHRCSINEVVNIKEATTFEEASKSRDQNNPTKVEILKGHGRHDACKVSGTAHNKRKEKIKLVSRGSIRNSSPT